MSLLKKVFPVALAVGLGVLNGVFTFKPALDDYEQKKFEEKHGIVRTPREPVTGEGQAVESSQTLSAGAIPTPENAKSEAQSN